MKTRLEQEALDNRKDDPDILKTIMDMRNIENQQLKLTYPDGRQKTVNVGGVNLQRLREHCALQGVKMELVQEERS